MGPVQRQSASASAFLVAFVIFAIAGFDEWLTGNSKYLRDGAFALFYLGFGVVQLRRWRQRLRM
jgi:hypothetical protein